jgi:DNA-binding CsgD family transcriptional regulator
MNKCLSDIDIDQTQDFEPVENHFGNTHKGTTYFGSQDFRQLPNHNYWVFDFGIEQDAEGHKKLSIIPKYPSINKRFRDMLDITHGVNEVVVNEISKHLDYFNQRGFISNDLKEDIYFVGLEVLLLNGTRQKLLVHLTAIRSVTHFQAIVQDISHLYKSNFYWLCCHRPTHEAVFYHSQQQQYSQTACISQRERVVLEKIVSGLTTNQIAETLFVSPITVENHKQKMLKKTGAKDIVALATLCKLCKIL